MQECQLVELASGTVMMNMRNAHLNKSCDCRAVSLSHDGGLTWSKPSYSPELIEPTCSAGLINVNSDTSSTDTLFFSNPADTIHRDKMTVRRSDDGGATWPQQRQVWAGPVAYSVLVPVNKTHVGLVFENGDTSPYERISFVALPHEMS
jgi:sialidase-1